jgi:hypothetical protein
MNFKDIITKNYENLTKLKNELLNNNKYYINIIDNSDEKILDVFNKKQKYFSSNYETLGTYDTNTNLFIWSNTHIIIDKKFIKKIKEIRNKSKKIEKYIITGKYTDISYMERIYYYLVNNIFIISQDNIDELLEFCVSISKTYGIVQDKKNNNLFIIYLLTDIIS